MQIKSNDLKILFGVPYLHGCTVLHLFSLEERQRAEKRNREAKGDDFVPKWFDRTEDIVATPWGDLEVYRYNGKYTAHRNTVDSSDAVVTNDVQSIEFNPWQYADLSE